MVSGYVIQRVPDGAFVSDPSTNGTGGSYHANVLKARIYPSYEAADKARCPGNETVRPLAELFRRTHG